MSLALKKVAETSCQDVANKLKLIGVEKEEYLFIWLHVIEFMAYGFKPETEKKRICYWSDQPIKIEQ